MSNFIKKITSEFKEATKATNAAKAFNEEVKKADRYIDDTVKKISDLKNKKV